jgi:hypothetical protein
VSKEPRTARRPARVLNRQEAADIFRKVVLESTGDEVSLKLVGELLSAKNPNGSGLRWFPSKKTGNGYRVVSTEEIPFEIQVLLVYGKAKKEMPEIEIIEPSEQFEGESNAI